MKIGLYAMFGNTPNRDVLNFPMGLGTPVGEVLHKKRKCEQLGVMEFILELPIRLKRLDQDMRSWANLLGVQPTIEAGEQVLTQPTGTQ